MLKQLALILAVVVVALLAIIAALSIINRGPDEDPPEEDPPAATTGPRTTFRVSVGTDGGPVEIGCLLPEVDQSPLLVTFENGTAFSDDYLARVEVRHEDGVVSTVVAEASNLRPGERREVLPEPWLDPDGLVSCEVVAIQASDQVILVESG